MNKVYLSGNLGSDAEVKELPNGTKVSKLSLATNESYKDSKTNEWVKKTTWHNVVVYRDCSDFKKGERVFVEGKIEMRDWQDKEGNKRQNFEIVVGTYEGQINKFAGKQEDIHQVYEQQQTIENVGEIPF